MASKLSFDISRRSTVPSVTDEGLSLDDQRLLDRASELVWNWERPRFRKVFADQLRRQTRYAKAIPTSGLEVTALSVASLIWTRTATLLAIPALVLNAAGAKVREPVALTIAQVALWVLVVIAFVLAIVKMQTIHRFKKRSD